VQDVEDDEITVGINLARDGTDGRGRRMWAGFHGSLFRSLCMDQTWLLDDYVG
jgi:hypothetical protein